MKKGGVYSNDLCWVVATADQNTQITVKFVPRIDFTALEQEKRDRESGKTAAKEQAKAKEDKEEGKAGKKGKKDSKKDKPKSEGKRKFFSLQNRPLPKLFNAQDVMSVLQQQHQPHQLPAQCPASLLSRR
jgi:hypothetical protein